MKRFLYLTLVIAMACASPEKYDLIIRNAYLVKGDNGEIVKGDLAVKEGKIAAIGNFNGVADKEIDASGKYLSPGWIDMMDQSGPILLEDGRAVNKLKMGVTTSIGGEGGIRRLEGEGHEIDISVDSVPAYFSQLEKHGISMNFGTYYGAAQLRKFVIGWENIPASKEDMDSMLVLADKAMKYGAFGFATALIYKPAAYASTEELIEISKVAAKYKGHYASHIRDEGSGLIGAVEEAIRIGRESGAKVEVFHMKAAYEAGWDSLLPLACQKMTQAQAEGVEVYGDIYPYPAGGTGLDATIPSWVFDGGHEAMMKKLSDPKIRSKMKEQLKTGAEGWWNIIEACGGWQNVMLSNSYLQEYESYHNMRFDKIGEALGKDPADVAWDIFIKASPKRPMAIYFMMSELDVANGLSVPWMTVGSDAGAIKGEGGMDLLGLAHPRSYGTFPRIIAKYVKEDSVLTLSEAIYKMTGLSAQHMGLKDRGELKVGYWADLVIFDLESIKDNATWDQPTLFPSGIDYVFVNGQLTVDHGKHLGTKAGQVLYGPGKE